MLTHDYNSNNDDGLNGATLRTFSKNRPLLDNEHVRQYGPNPLHNALSLSATKLFPVLFKY